MTTYLGRDYDEHTDWGAVIRTAAEHPLGPVWLRSDLDVPSGLSDLFQAVEHTPAGAAFIEAALVAAETGSKAEQEVVWQIPWERANNASARLLTLIRQHPDRAASLHGAPNIVWRLMVANPQAAQDADLVRELKTQAAAHPNDRDLQQLVAKYG
jgi:hypothetical protein